MKEEDAFEIRSVENSECFLAANEQHVSRSRSLCSCGRMACGEARILRTWDLSSPDFQRTDWPNPIRVHEGWKTEVIHVDTYGNAITAFPAVQANGVQAVLLPEGSEFRSNAFYAAVPRGRSLAVIGSSGFVEIAINQGDAARELGLRTGSEVIIVCRAIALGGFSVAAGALLERRAFRGFKSHRLVARGADLSDVQADKPGHHENDQYLPDDASSTTMLRAISVAGSMSPMLTVVSVVRLK